MSTLNMIFHSGSSLGCRRVAEKLASPRLTFCLLTLLQNRTIIIMGIMEEKRTRFQAQIAELFRLAEEAESSAKLLRQQAEIHQKMLRDPNLSEDQLDAMLAEKTELPEIGKAKVQVTERLM